MVDNLTSAQRSKNMSRIRSKDTKPEIIVRKKLHSIGYRYSLHKKKLPGKPDIFLKKLNLAIFVHGCFWHHHGCKYSNIPKTNTEFWKNKFRKNKSNDKKHSNSLKKQGIKTKTIWECQIKFHKNDLENYLRKIIVN